MKTMKKILACGVLGVLLLPQTQGFAQVTTNGDDVTNVAHRVHQDTHQKTRSQPLIKPLRLVRITLK